MLILNPDLTRVKFESNGVERWENIKKINLNNKMV